MTVITKAIGEKKLVDNMERPLITDTKTSAHHDPKAADPEAQHSPRDMAGHYLILRRPHLSPHSMTLYFLIFTSLVGMSIGVLGGVCIYRHFAREQVHRFRTGWYSIPYQRLDNENPFAKVEFSAVVPADNDLVKSYSHEAEQEASVLDKTAQNSIRDFLQVSKDLTKDFFREYFEIDVENERYERIDVPDFRDGRQGRFIHDFNVNLTGIIDLSGHCCFIMPLNRERVLLPRNMYDLLNKMYEGCYEVNTEVVRKTMRAVFPAIRDRSTVGKYIDRECENMPIYALEKKNESITGGMVKRSIEGVVFGHFAGNNIVEYDIENMNEVQKNAELETK